MTRIRLQWIALGAIAACSSTIFLHAADAPPQGSANVATANNPAARAQALVDRGLAYLKPQQKPDGGWQTADEPPAITAICIKAFCQDPHYKGDEPFIQKGFEKLLSFQKPDGSISDDTLATYNTAIAISAMSGPKEATYKQQMLKALAFLRDCQFGDKIEGVPANLKVPESNANYGGFGYGQKRKNADGSNMQIALDALKDSGLKPDDPAFQAALKFATRLQNSSETNDQKWAGNDGGFIYSAADGGGSKAGEIIGANGMRMWRSYGSMTYAGLKSMIYAGLSHDDPRVKAAWDWIRHNWTLDENPGVKYGDPNNPKGGDDGLFYYYHTLARALHAYGESVIVDSKGNRHDWRLELIDKLAAQQHEDGSWTGIQKWMENKPTLSTAYAILALQEAQQDLKEHPVSK